MKRILILEDDIRLGETLATILACKFKVETASKIAEAAKLISSTRFDAIVADFILNDGNGFNLLNLLDKVQPRPKVIFITAYAEKDMAVKLLNKDVNGLLEKPFEYSKLMKILEADVLCSDASRKTQMQLLPYEKTILVGEKAIELTDVEFKIVGYLLAQKDTWVPRQDLIDYIWGDSIQSRNTLDTHLSNLKRKLPNFKMDLQVVRGRGYLYSPEL